MANTVFFVRVAELAKDLADRRWMGDDLCRIRQRSGQLRQCDTPMGMVERENVTNAMVAFGAALRDSKAAMAESKGGHETSSLTIRSLDLAHACREELALEWSASWAR